MATSLGQFQSRVSSRRNRQRVGDGGYGVVDRRPQEQHALQLGFVGSLRAEVAIGLELAAWCVRDAWNARGDKLIECGGRFGVDVRSYRARNRFQDRAWFPDRLEVRNRSEHPRQRSSRVVGYDETVSC